jgi:anaerobic magnesium-protoporphyrin IX monomethyl ester cyclase
MRVALIYPPPWKIPGPGQAPDAHGDGPPPGYLDGDLDADFYQIPYGLLSLAAQAIRAGHDVKVLNLSAHPWSEVDALVRALDADVYGISCWTANRRGVALVARCVRAHHPGAQVVVGGPHATALAAEMLAHHQEIDVVAIGEGEETLIEILDRLAKGEPVRGVAGTAYRTGGRIAIGPRREAIRDLDSLAPPHGQFDTHIVMTSRGCPFSCTFCGAEKSWGRGLRSQSTAYVLDAIEKVLPRLAVKMIQIKDDTFTADAKRTMQLCRAIRERDLRFLWSCDTRGDLLNESLLLEMRRAGCQRISIGVESGSPKVLAKIGKRIDLSEVVRSTDLAKKCGIRVRYYLMLGNRGETAETVRETLAFLEVARPHEYLFACLSIYPGTRDFGDAEALGRLDRETYFTQRFQEYKTPFDASDADTAMMGALFREKNGLQQMHRDDVSSCEAILDRVGDHHAAHMDLGAAYYHEGRLDDADRHVRRALDRGFPLPGLAHNHLACIAKARGDLDKMMDEFSLAAKMDPQHHVLIRNVNRARAWFKHGGPSKNLPLELDVSHDFQLLERTVQPMLPGPLPDGIIEWPARSASP